MSFILHLHVDHARIFDELCCGEELEDLFFLELPLSIWLAMLVLMVQFLN